MNAALPMPRRAWMRPAMRYRESVSAPASRSPCAARPWAIGTTPSKACGDGSTPSARRRSSLARRSAPGCGASSLTGETLFGASGFDLRDLQLARAAARQRDAHDLVALSAHQRLADRRLVRELRLGRVRLGRADDPVLDRLLGLLVLDVHRRPDADHVRGDVVLVEQRRRAQLLLELGDLLLEHRLLVLGVVVLRVLGDVAERPGLLDPLRHLFAASRGQVLDLGLQILESLLSEDDFLRHFNPCRLWRTRESSKRNCVLSTLLGSRRYPFQAVQN